MDSDLIGEGDQVVFVRHGSSRVFQVRKNRQVYFEKNKFYVEELLGQPYGSCYEIDRGKLTKVNQKTKTSELQTDTPAPEPGADNRNLQDLDSNQKMSKDDIMKMKEEGITGEKIIEELIEKSETFKNKTEYSQAKYLKKKKKKHILEFIVLRPTPRLVMDIFSKEPGKICYLRPDTLSQVLSYSNIMSGSHVAVVETCQGLVLSCVLQRLGGQGKLIQLVPDGSGVCRQVMGYFGFSQSEWDNVYSFPMDRLAGIKNGADDDDKTQQETCNNADNNDEKETPVTDEGKDGDVPMTDEVSGDTGETIKEEGSEESKPFVSNRLQQRIAKEARLKEAAKIISEKKIDSLIIACRYNPVPIVKNMLEFLQPSRNVVVFCQFIDPLVQIYSFVKENRVGLEVKLSETWLREYQILPQRTHPMINMSGTGGYLLSFITCDPSNPG